MENLKNITGAGLFSRNYLKWINFHTDQFIAFSKKFKQQEYLKNVQTQRKYTKSLWYTLVFIIHILKLATEATLTMFGHRNDLTPLALNTYYKYTKVYVILQTKATTEATCLYLAIETI